MTGRVPFDVAAYERAVSRLGGCFICGFLAGKRGMDHELLYDDGMWRPLDGSMDGRSDMLPPLDPPGCADRRTCKVNLDDLRWDRPDLDCEFEQARGIRRNLQLDETDVLLSRDSWRYPEVVGEWVAKSRDSWRGVEVRGVSPRPRPVRGSWRGWARAYCQS